MDTFADTNIYPRFVLQALSQKIVFAVRWKCQTKWLPLVSP